MTRRIRSPLSDEQRRRLSERGKAWWQSLTPEQRADLRARQRATFEERFPHRVRLYADLRQQLEIGELERGSCDTCGGPGAMQLRFDDEAETVEVIGWRCYPCRRAA